MALSVMSFICRAEALRQGLKNTCLCSSVSHERQLKGMLLHTCVKPSLGQIVRCQILSPQLPLWALGSPCEEDTVAIFFLFIVAHVVNL